MKKTHLKNFSPDELAAFMNDWDEKAFRARQLWTWLYAKPAGDFSEMTTLSKDLRGRLQKSCHLNMLSLEKKTAGTTPVVKYLWKCLDGALIESVYIPEGKRRTFCVSSQVGCTLGCAICATGRMGWKRNLQPGEMTDQVVQMIRSLDLRPTNLVLMGMGEPLLNYKHVMKALHILNDPDGAAIGHRKITISTAGIIPAINTFMKEKQPFKLAVSLNATTDRQRSLIMPVNRKYPLHELLRTVRTYTESSKKRITFEYVLIRDFNDTPEDAERLKRLLKGIPCKINLIACNPVDKQYQRPSEAKIASFAEILRRLNAPVTLRMSKGCEIKGACGQLAVSTDNKEGKPL